VRFEKPTKAEVLPRIRFRETADLDEVGDHVSSILPAKGSLRLPHAPAHYSLARPNLLPSSPEVNLRQR